MPVCLADIWRSFSVCSNFGAFDTFQYLPALEILMSCGQKSDKNWCLIPREHQGSPLLSQTWDILIASGD